MRRGRLRLGLAAVLPVLVSSSPALAVLSRQFFVSANQTLYYMVAANPSPNSVGVQVTSLVMSSGTALSLNETPANPPDPVVTALATFISGGFLGVPPLSNIRRTEMLGGLPSNSIVNMGSPAGGVFDPNANNGNGLLTLPGGTRTVTFDGSGTETVLPVTMSSGAGGTLVPAATMIFPTRRLGLTTFAAVPTLVFPDPAGPAVTSNGATCFGGTNPGTPCSPQEPPPDICTGGGACTNFGGEAAGQNVTLDDTLGSRVGNPSSQGATIDGFFIPNSTAVVVFIVQFASSSVGLSATGFNVTGTCSNAATACGADEDCPGGTCTTGLEQRNVVDTTGVVDNAIDHAPPTFTASNTPTITPTTMLTPSVAPTDTAVQTSTRPSIPAVPSPMSLSGLLMIGALGTCLLWFLRRLFEQWNPRR